MKWHIVQGLFLVSSGAEIWPLSQWDLGDFFPNLKKKIPNLEKIFFFFFYFLEFSFSHLFKISLCDQSIFCCNLNIAAL